MILNTIMMNGQGGDTKTITVDLPPYSSLYGRYIKNGKETVVGWPNGDAQTLVIPVVVGAFYELKSNVSIPVGTTRQSVDVFTNTFTVTDDLESISMIPSKAIFWYGWENPEYVRQTAYVTSTSAEASKLLHRSGSSSSTSVWTAAQVDLMSLDKQNHCYAADLNLYNGSMLHSLGYETHFETYGKKYRYVNCFSDLWWPGETSTSTDILLRYDYHAQGNNVTFDTTSQFWAAAVGSGNHCNVTYNQFRTSTVPSGGEFLAYETPGLLRMNGYVDMPAINYSNTSLVRLRFALRTYRLPRESGAYYHIYVVTASSDRIIPPAIS